MRHAGGEIAPGLAEHHDHAAGHVLAAVVPGAFHHGRGAAVADGKAFPGAAGDKQRAARSAIEHRVPDDGVLTGRKTGLLRRANDDLATAHALTDVNRWLHRRG